jgi:hypothetical protein
MPYNPNTGQWEYLNSSQGFDQHPGQRSPQPPTTPPGAYNNPWYDSQLIGQQAQGGSFQPMPYQPDLSGGNGGGMDYANPPYSPDRFGSGGGGGGFGSYNPQGIGATTQPVQNPDIWHTPIGGTFTNEFGQQQAITPISFGPRNGGVGNGGSWFGGSQQAQLYPTGGGSQLSGFNGAGSYGKDPGMNYASGSGSMNPYGANYGISTPVNGFNGNVNAYGQVDHAIGNLGGNGNFSYFGAQGGYPQGYFGDPSTWDAGKRFRLSDPYWSLPMNPDGSQKANPNGPMGGGLTRPGADSVNVNGQQVGLYPASQSQGMQTPTPVPMPGQAAATAINPDAAYPKYDPAFLSQIQSALESRTGPYAGRQPGDYGPTGAPDFVLNPQTQDDWIKRFYFFAANPGALDNPTAPRQVQAAQVPWQQFAKDVYSDANANRSFNELSGVVDDARLQQAQDVFGWQLGPNGLASNDAAVAQATQMKAAHPEYSYQVYARPDGSYGIAARELEAQAQESRGFISPATAARLAAERAAAMQNPHPVSNSYSRSGGGGYSKSGSGSSYGKGGGSGGGGGGGGVSNSLKTAISFGTSAANSLAQALAAQNAQKAKQGPGAGLGIGTHPGQQAPHPVPTSPIPAAGSAVQAAIEAAKRAIAASKLPPPQQQAVVQAPNILNQIIQNAANQSGGGGGNYIVEGQLSPDGSHVWRNGYWQPV